MSENCPKCGADLYAETATSRTFQCGSFIVGEDKKSFCESPNDTCMKNQIAALTQRAEQAEREHATPANEPDDFRDRVAIAAMQSLILKVSLHDRQGEHGIHTPEIPSIHQVRMDIAESAYDYADAMRTARCAVTVADNPTPPVEFTVNADGPLDVEATACLGEVAKQVVYGKRRKA